MTKENLFMIWEGVQKDSFVTSINVEISTKSIQTFSSKTFATLVQI